MRVTIRNNATGESRSYHDDSKWCEGADGDSAYLWADGNYSCDCNRALFFARAAGEDDPEDTPCGESLFTVTGIHLDDGRLVYSEPQE